MIHMVQFFELLKSKTPVKIIRFFLEYPTNDFYEREIQTKTGLSKGSVNKWIRKLEETGIIESKVKGRLRIFKLNNSNPLIKQLKILYIIDKIYHKVKKFNDCRVFLYGSAARGEYDEKSDIDIFAEMPPKFNLLMKLQEELESQLKHKIDLIRFREKMNPRLKENILRDGLYV